MNLDAKIDIILKNMNDGKWYPLYDFIEHWLGDENSSLGEDQILIDKMIEDGLIKKSDDGNKYMITPTGRSINDKGGWLTTQTSCSRIYSVNTTTRERKKREKRKKILERHFNHFGLSHSLY